MSNLQHFKYNANDYNTQSFQYGSDQNFNVCSLLNIASYPLFNGVETQVGFIEFVDTSIATRSTNNFQNSDQLYYETGSFFVDNVGTFTYSISFIAGSSYFSAGTVVPTIISATGAYYKNIKEIAINVGENGDRDVWISLKDE